MITTLINADEVEWLEDCEKQDAYQHFAMKYPKLYQLNEKFFELLCWLMEKTICKLRGHDIEMHGYCGPDSGWEDWWCTRCHVSGRHVYY